MKIAKGCLALLDLVLNYGKPTRLNLQRRGTRVKPTTTGFALATCIALSAFSLFAQQVAAPAATSVVPRLINFSGVVRGSDGKPLTGTVGVTFSLFKDQEGGPPLWFETQNVQADNSGRYKLWLGASKPEGLPMELFASGEARWLGVQVEGQSEQPRVLLLSVPYALKAADAETVGGLPPSAFVLADSKSASTAPRSTTLAAAAVVPLATGTNAVTTAGGTVNSVAKFDGAADVTPSQIYDDGTHVGIGNTSPAATLDVGGTSIFRGVLTLPALGTASAAGGFNSNALDLIASVYRAGESLPGPVSERFRWQAEPVHNNTSSARATLNLLFSQGFNAVQETGVSIDRTGVLSVSGLQASGVVNATGFSLNGTPFASGNYGSGNVFLGFSGNGSATGTSNTASGASALTSDTTGGANTAIGQAALWQNTSGSNNTATGEQALTLNTTGSSNTATGLSALVNNTTGNGNTAAGYATLKSNATGGNNSAFGYYAGNTTNQLPTTGSNNTFVGSYANPGAQTALSNATAIGANAQVTASNAMVLGSIASVNGATANTNVGIGTSAPRSLLHVNQNVPAGGADLLAITSGGSPGVGSLLLQNTATGGLFLRAGAGTGEAYLASNGPLAFITAGTNSPSGPGPAAMAIDTLGNVLVSSGLMRINTGGLSLGGTAPLAVDAAGVPGGRFTVMPLGNVGINNPNPTSALDVTGNIHATAAIFASAAVIPGQVQTGALQASSLQLNGDTPMSSAPRMTFAAIFPGSFCASPNCGSFTSPPALGAGMLIPDRAIYITHISVYIKDPIDASCIPPNLVVWTGPGATNVAVATYPLTTGSYISDFVVSPPLSIPAGTQVTVNLSPLTTGCNVGSNGGGDGFANIQYVMQ